MQATDWYFIEPNGTRHGPSYTEVQAKIEAGRLAARKPDLSDETALKLYRSLEKAGWKVRHTGMRVEIRTASSLAGMLLRILRVDEDQEGEVRVYFYNPNNDSGQNWGCDVTVSTSGHGERYGEGLLRFEQFLSRVYLFHDEPLRDKIAQSCVPDNVIARVRDRSVRSWAASWVSD